MDNTPEIDALLAAPLRGEAAPWPAAWSGSPSIEAVHRRLFFHGIAGLLHARSNLLQDWPAALRQAMRDEARARAAWELGHRARLAPLIAALDDKGINAAMLKGTALAYALYDEPALRTRGDSDLLILKSDLPTARTILGELGWECCSHQPGPFGSMHEQETWRQCDSAGLTHDIDLHWEVTPLRALRQIFDAADLLNAAIPLPRLAPQARCADPVTRLLHGIVNRALHAQSGYYSINRNEYDADRLIWAYDFHLEASGFGASDWERFYERCEEMQLSPLGRDALTFTQRALGTEIADDVIGRLALRPDGTRITDIIAASNSNRGIFAGLAATPGIGEKLRYLMAKAFPSSLHLKAKYPQAAHWPIPLLYIRRQAAALRTLLRARAN